MFKKGDLVRIKAISDKELCGPGGKTISLETRADDLHFRSLTVRSGAEGIVEDDPIEGEVLVRLQENPKFCWRFIIEDIEKV